MSLLLTISHRFGLFQLLLELCNLVAVLLKVVTIVNCDRAFTAFTV
jgi:hypothetical protein